MKPARLLIAVAACLALALALSRATPAPPAAQPRPMSAEAAYWWNRALGSGAALVSRYQFPYLRPLRSWQDLERLREYVTWAGRPESVRLSGTLVEAGVSAYDLILLRIPAAAIEAPGKVLRDPLGYAVLDPGRQGRLRLPVTVLITQVRAPVLPPGLPAGAMPVIHAAVAASPSIVEIYGAGFYGTKVRVLTRRGEAALLYLGPHQINARVDALDAVAVDVDGLRSDWVEVRR